MTNGLKLGLYPDEGIKEKVLMKIYGPKSKRMFVRRV
jgi:hypothetical protein